MTTPPHSVRASAPSPHDRGRGDAGGSMPSVRQSSLAALAFAAILLALNVRLVAGIVAPHWDAEDFFAPAFSLVADHARAGKVVLWDPWVAGGSPDFAEPEFGTASPITVGVGFLAGGSELGFRAYWLLLWYLGPVGLIVLARHLGAPAWGGFIAALGFAFSGFYTGHAEHTSSLYSISLLPFVVWRLDAALLSRRIRAAAEAGALWGLSALGGYPELTVLTGAYVFLWAIGRWCCREDHEPGLHAAVSDTQPPSGRPRLLFTIGAVVTVAAVGILVLSPSYLGYFTETFGYSDRVGPRPRRIAVGLQPLALGALSTFSSPYLSILKLFGNPGLWKITDVSMSSVYLGASVFVLSLFALALRPRSPWRWWLAGVGLFFILGSLGDQFPLRGWLYDLFPPTRYFRNPALFRVYAMFSAVVLAISATRDIRSTLTGAGAHVWGRLLCVATVAAGGAIAAYTAILTRVQARGPALAFANIHLVLVWGGVVAVAGIATTRTGKTWLPASLVVLAMLDAGGAFGISQPTIYTTATRPRWDRINHERRPDLLIENGLARSVRPPEWLGPQLNNRNIPLRIATFANYMTMSNRFQQQFVAHPILASMSAGADRIWFASDVAIVAPTDAAYAAFRERSRRLGAPVLAIHSREQMSRIYQSGETTRRDAADSEAIGNLPVAVRLTARVIRYDPTHLHFRVTCPARGWLLVTDRWAPGWSATVNAVRTEVLGGNFVFRAIGVEAGTNDVSFSYGPRGWLPTLLLSWGTMLAIVASRIVNQRR